MVESVYALDDFYVEKIVIVLLLISVLPWLHLFIRFLIVKVTV